MRRYIRVAVRDELGKGGEGKREGKSVGDERSQRDPREGGYEDELKGCGCFWWGAFLRLLEQQMGIDKQSKETNFINEKTGRRL